MKEENLKYKGKSKVKKEEDEEGIRRWGRWVWRMGIAGLEHSH